MSSDLDLLLSNYGIKSSQSELFFWKKEKHVDGKSYPIPIEEKYVDLIRVILGLHIIELDHLTDKVGPLEIKTNFPNNFLSIVDELESVFYHLTNAKIKLEIGKVQPRGIWKRLDASPLQRNIILFSGGLDSLCGALSFFDSHKTILAHCITNQVILNKVWKLSTSAELRRSILYCLDSRTKAMIGGSSETRGLLFLAFAYSIAASLGIRSLNFCENGSQMLDVMLGSLVYPNKWATKNTNPVYIKKIENIFSNFDDKEFRILLPFQNFTKAEVLNRFKKEIKLEDTISCFTTRGLSLMCGTCWNCFIRKMSLLAIDVDEESLYEVDPLRTQEPIGRVKILFHLLRFYAHILMKEPYAINEIELNARTLFDDPVNLATRFAKDIFLGIMKSLEKHNGNTLNALGKKALELLNQVDRNSLLDREEELKKQIVFEKE